ncbi:hypothetical protein SDJN02_01145, partial [Cucurbita argyrosperma subsp. argyrosperma]
MGEKKRKERNGVSLAFSIAGPNGRPTRRAISSVVERAPDNCVIVPELRSTQNVVPVQAKKERAVGEQPGLVAPFIFPAKRDENPATKELRIKPRRQWNLPSILLLLLLVRFNFCSAASPVSPLPR